MPDRAPSTPQHRAPRAEPDEQTPPQPAWVLYDVAREAALLGQLLRSGRAVARVLATELRAADFAGPGHGAVFDAVVAEYQATGAADLAGVGIRVEATARDQGWDESWQHSVLADLAAGAPGPDPAEVNAAAVYELGLRRRLYETGLGISALADPSASRDESAVDTALRLVDGVRHPEPAAHSGPRALRQFVEEVAAGLARPGSGTDDGDPVVQRPRAAHRGVATGHALLDELTGGGLHPGHLTVVAGRPAVGKTALVLGWARHCALRLGHAAMYVALGEGNNEIAMRILAAEARVPLHALRSGDMRDRSWTRLARVIPAVAEAPLYLDAPSRLTLAELRVQARKIRYRGRLHLLVVDYVQLFQAEPVLQETPYYEMSRISRGLKKLARDLDVPVVAVSQLNRNPEREDRPPQLHDLRDSGTLEDDADLVVLVHRNTTPTTPPPGSQEAGHAALSDHRAGCTATLIVAKHRHGPTATLPTGYQGRYSRFYNRVGP